MWFTLLDYVAGYSPILTSEGSKVRRVHCVAREMEIRINTAYILSIAQR